ncbi:hypothetical protein AAFF_G00059410 [Aldrovandia affinis]|uniref:Uncharacterized protein n=1 Tax=Aldrovandia affinis TaxID=143900 RepID=A0AAD7S062_9TELE|nr:hypothetical protein AAFF_G00059410 [Aldrovandia affinis]
MESGLAARTTGRGGRCGSEGVENRSKLLHPREVMCVICAADGSEIILQKNPRTRVENHCVTHTQSVIISLQKWAGRRRFTVFRSPESYGESRRGRASCGQGGQSPELDDLAGHRPGNSPSL